MSSRVLRIIGLQVGVSFALSFLLLILEGRSAALSAFCGGASAFIPALAYQLRASLVRGRDAQDYLRAQYAGEGFKFAVSIVMFYLMFTRLKPLHAPEFFATYIAALLCYFAALLTDRDR